MKLLKNLKIKGKLRLPVYFQLFLLLTFGYFYYTIDHSISAQQENKKVVIESASKLRAFTSSLTGYFNHTGQKNINELETEYAGITKLIKNSPILRDADRLKPLLNLTSQLNTYNDLTKRTAEIEKQVFQLTDLSIQQSDGFLQQISGKLADRQQRNSVSDLERAVIAGAALNSNANFSIKVLFLQVKENLSLAVSLTSYLDQLIKNVETDVKRLAGTPFAQLPVKAKEANLKIKELSAKFIANLNQSNHVTQQIYAGFNSALEYMNKMDTDANAMIFTTIRQSFLNFLIIIIVLTLLAGLVSIATTRWIMKPLNAMTERAHELAVEDVDMTRRLHVEGKDELAELSGLFNQFLERLQHLIKDITNQSELLHQSTGEIRNGSDELATRTNQQAAAITETSATLEQFTAAIRANTENSAEADMMLVEFNNEIQEKSELIDNVTNTMTDIFESSKQIDNIIKVINDISFQTNLLALNAAVEAARAGDAGRGFAVVANEVRNLAQKTAESSKSIQQIVVRNVESTQKGMDLVKHTSEFFGEIVGVMGDIVTKISNITNVSREQATGIEQIGQTITQMERVSEQNAQLVQQLADAGQSVETKTNGLQEMVSYFKLDATSSKPDGALVTKSGSRYMEPDNERYDLSVDKHTTQSGVDKNEKRKSKQDVNRQQPLSTHTPTEDDFFGNVDDGFEEF